VLCASLATAGTAAAQTAEKRAQARALADQAANAYARGDYARAELLLDRAYARVPAPTVALLRARTLVHLQRWVAALQVYTSAANTLLDADAPEAFDSAVQDARRERDELEPRVPRLRLDVAMPLLEEPSLDVRLDGAVVSKERLGAFMAVDPGAHALTVEIEGRRVRALEVTLRERDRLVVPLEQPQPARSGSSKRTWGVVSAATGGAALGFGVVAGVIAMDAHSDMERECPDRQCPAGGSGAEAVDRFETFRTLSTIGYVAGAVGIGAGTYLILTSSKSEPRVVATTSLNGLHVRGSW
jgi:hypothetical protein